VDPYDDSLLTGLLKSRLSATEARDAAQCNLQGFEERYMWMLCTSEDAAEAVPDESLDFAFLDGDHTYDAIRNDIEWWLPKVRKGGILLGDDYTGRRKGVVRAVNARFRDKVLSCADFHRTIWWVWKDDI
jgi:predicted O-methyltransferase YrrM